jgi:hypothetical protein
MSHALPDPPQHGEQHSARAMRAVRAGGTMPPAGR